MAKASSAASGAPSACHGSFFASDSDGAIAAFRNMQAELRGIRLEDDGISLEHLDEVWQRETSAGKTVKLLYLVPNFQNHT